MKPNENINLFDNLDKIHNTVLGEERIRKNIKLSNNVDIVSYVISLIKDKDSTVTKVGKNFYVQNKNIKITINSYNFVIITAHLIKNS